MVHQFLRIIKDGEAQSQLEIARRMNVSPSMVVQIASDLARRGYLQEVNGDCCGDGVACGGCSTAHTCKVATTVWTLTEKGLKAVQG